VPVDSSHFRFECFECALASALFPRFLSLTHKRQREKGLQRFSARALSRQIERGAATSFVDGVNSSSSRRPLMDEKGARIKGALPKGPDLARLGIYVSARAERRHV